MDKVCKQCGASFSTEYKDKLYCTEKCKGIAQARRNGVQPMKRRSWNPGDRFGRLVLVGYVGSGSSRDGRQYWFCDCDCGTKNYKARADKLKNGCIKSCGCLRDEIAQKNHERTVQRQKEQRERLEILRAQRPEKRPTLEQQEVMKRHKSLSYLLKAEEIPATDPLWRLNYYSALIADNECHFCRGPLDGGISLDFIETEFKFLEAHNVVPACTVCMFHRTTPRGRLGFAEMELLGSMLEFIRLTREQEFESEFGWLGKDRNS